MDKNPDYQKLWKLAQSPAGRQLITMLQNTGGEALQQAMTSAQNGNYDPAKQLLSQLLSGEDAAALLKQLEASL